MLSFLKRVEEKELFKSGFALLDSNLQIEQSSGTLKGVSGEFTDLLAKGFKTVFQDGLSKLSNRRLVTEVDVQLSIDGDVPLTYKLFLLKEGERYHVIALETAAALKMKEESESMQKWALLDALTELLNRRGYWIMVENLVHSAAREGKGLGVVFFDMDSLKHINTTYGHEYGDNAIKEIARVMKDATRKTDVITRIGGDEFIIVFDLDPKKDFTVEDMCERVLSKTRKAGKFHSTVSIGGHLVKAGRVKEISEAKDFQNEWMKHMEIADEYSRAAKQKGKNQYITDSTFEKSQPQGFLKQSVSRLLAGIRS